jgi:hypothetical protein
VTTRSKSEIAADEVAAKLDAEVEKQTEHLPTQAKRRINSEELAQISSFEEAIKAAQEYGELLDSSDLGDGFSMGDKAALVGKKFVVIDWEYGKNNDYGNAFVIVRLVTIDNNKYIITDGSTGIMRQLELILQLTKGKTKSIICNNGLRASDYWVDDVTGQPVDESYAGKKKKATTYYIDQV